MQFHWYVLCSKPRKESSLALFASSQGFRVYYPQIPAHPVNPRASKQKPFFPGYMFVHVAQHELAQLTFQWMPFSSGLVHLGGEPAWVPDSLIDSLQARIRTLRNSGREKPRRFQTGDPVVVTEGVFQGYEGVFDIRLSGDDRARILLKMISDRYIPVEVHERQLESIKKDLRSFSH